MITWLRNFAPSGNTTSLFSLLNVYQSGDAYREGEIVGKVAGYGDQLNRIVDALNVLVTEELTTGGPRLAGEQKALEDFSAMAGKIGKYKEDNPRKAQADTCESAEGNLPVDSINEFLDALEYVKEHNTETYADIRDRLRGLLGDDK